MWRHTFTDNRRKQLKPMVAGVLLAAIMTTSIPIEDAYAAVRKSITDLEWIFTTEIDEESHAEEIMLEADPLKEGIEVTAIELPNGEIEENTSVSYTATENGEYDFVIYYDKEKASNTRDGQVKIQHKRKEVSYKVKDLDEISYEFTSAFVNEEETEKEITLEAHSDSKYTIAGIQDPDGNIQGGYLRLRRK